MGEGIESPNRSLEEEGGKSTRWSQPPEGATEVCFMSVDNNFDNSIKWSKSSGLITHPDLRRSMTQSSDLGEVT